MWKALSRRYSLLGALSATSRKRVLAIIAIAVLSAIVLASGTVSYSTNIAVFNISAFWQGLPELGLLEMGIWVWVATGCALIILVAALPRKIGIFFIAFIFLFSIYFQIRWHSISSAVVSLRWKSVLTLREQFEPGTCVGFDHQTIEDYNKHVFWYDFGLILFDYRLQRLPFRNWLNKCDGPLFTYAKNLDEFDSEIYPTTSSRNQGPVAWMKGRPPKDSYPITISPLYPTSTLSNALSSGWSSLEMGYVWSGADALTKTTCSRNLQIRRMLRYLDIKHIWRIQKTPYRGYLRSKP